MPFLDAPPNKKAAPRKDIPLAKCLMGVQFNTRGNGEYNNRKTAVDCYNNNENLDVVVSEEVEVHAA